MAPMMTLEFLRPESPSLGRRLGEEDWGRRIRGEGTVCIPLRTEIDYYTVARVVMIYLCGCYIELKWD